jgi:hypothetical protein
MQRLVMVMTVAVCLSIGHSAFAQGPYVNASVGVSVSRFSRFQETGTSGISPGGEPASWALRVGSPLGARWGVELEFVRTLESDSKDTFDLLRGLPAGLNGGIFTSLEFVPTGSGSTSSGLFPLLPFDISVRVREQQSAIVPTVWFQSDVSQRVAIVFLGGVAFNRLATDTEFSVAGADPGLLARITFPAPTRSIEYGTSAVAGVEARIGLGDNVQLIPGVRLQGLTDGWSVRPAVGLGWQF